METPNGPEEPQPEPSPEPSPQPETPGEPGDAGTEDQKEPMGVEA